MEKIAIVGMGAMGSAIGSLLKEDYEVVGLGRADSLEQIENTDAVILAVKPQSFGELAYDLKPYVSGQLIISIMAGTPLGVLSETLGTDLVVRTMPNLGLTVGKSMTAWQVKSEAVDRRLLLNILGAWGSCLELEEEDQFAAFTALAGSGPAYFYELARNLEQTAMGLGFDAEQARQIVAQTFLGAASVVTADTKFDEQVRRVASKGGTTEAALRVFAQHKLGQTIDQAVGAACCRSEELGQLLNVKQA